MTGEKLHFGWQVEDLVSDPTHQLGARWEYIAQVRRAGPTEIFEQALETHAAQLFAGKLLFEEAELIARFLVRRRPTRFRLGLLSVLAEASGDHERSQQWARDRDALPMSETDRASEALQRLGSDPSWPSLSPEEKRRRFVEAGLTNDE